MNGTTATESPAADTNATQPAPPPAAPAPTPELPANLAALRGASPEQIKMVLGMLGPEFEQRARVALGGVQPQPTQQAPQPPAPFPQEPATRADAPRVVVPEFRWQPPLSFKPLRPDFLLYDPRRVYDEAKQMGPGILGILLANIELPKQTSAGRALIIRCIEPVPCVTNTGLIVDSRPGEDILVEVSHWLRSLVRRSEDQNNVGEIWLQPLELRMCEGGDYMPYWRIEHGPTHPRSSVTAPGVLPRAA